MEKTARAELGVRLRVVQEKAPGYVPGPSLTEPAQVWKAVRGLFQGLDREEFWVLLLDGRNHSIGCHQISVGSLTASIVHPREVFKVAYLANAGALIALHNHPSGDPTPSAEDRTMHARLSEAGKLLGITLLDSLVIGEHSYVSMVEEKG